MLNISEYGHRAWEDGTPLLTPAAVEYLGEVITPRFWVFEWGAGGSTVWFARHAGRVVSVEHQRGWYDKVADRLAEEGLQDAVRLHLVPLNSRAYAGLIKVYSLGTFDLVLVDGRARVACMTEARGMVKPGGMLVLDNADRVDRYARGIALLSGWKRVDFPDLWLTSIFIKPD